MTGRKYFRFACLSTLILGLLAPFSGKVFAASEKAVLDINFDKSKKISDLLFGVFFEDINYAADGGLYAELIRNRDFEFSEAIGDGRGWNATTAWNVSGNGMTLRIEEENPISKNNRHYAVLDTAMVGEALLNEGFRGIPLKKNAQYVFSVYTRNYAQGVLPFTVKLVDTTGKVYASARLSAEGGTWKQVSSTLTATDDCESAMLSIVPATRGKLCLDMVSLFPKDTFKGRKNGLRKDLAQALADLKPKFIRFPGGCVAHSGLPIKNGQPHSGLIENPGVYDIYYWKDSVGKLEDRLPIHNRWGYHQTRGLGYYEYMLFCEDIGAEPLPILPCGVDCQFTGGGQKAVPLDEMPLEIRNVLDLVEFANGATTTKWGKVRASMGHPKPFHLKYIGLGNEESITENFEVRFKMIADALKKAYPDIIVVGTVGPGAAGRDFENGWRFARAEKIPIVDEHFYQPPEWFPGQFHRYDNYDRSGPKVYAGEYAAHERGQRGNRRNTMETALSEAVFLAGVERNGDVVAMTSYAPLFSKVNDTQWYPDMIVFNNNEILPTTTYEVQKMFGANAGTIYIDNTITADGKTPLQSAFANTMVSSVVRDSAGDVIIKLVNISNDDFNFSIKLNKLTGSFSPNATYSTISGEWKDTKFTLKDGTVRVSRNFSFLVKSKTMSVIRIKSNLKAAQTKPVAGGVR